MKLLRLKEILKEKNLTQGELAEKVNVSSQTISNIITGSNFPKPDLLHNIAQALDIDIRDLFYSTKESEELNGFIEYNGEVYRIRSVEDLNQLSQKIG